MINEKAFELMKVGHVVLVNNELMEYDDAWDVANKVYHDYCEQWEYLPQDEQQNIELYAARMCVEGLPCCM